MYKHDYMAKVTEALRLAFPQVEDVDLDRITDALTDLCEHLVSEHTSDYEHTTRDRY